MAAVEQARVRPVDLVTETLSGRDELVAVTGATGWFGSVALDLLYAAFGDRADYRIVGYASDAREVAISDGRTARVRPLSDLLSQDPPPTTLLHFAYLTRDKVAALGIDAYVSQNVAITATVLDAISRHRPRHLVVASSGAVHSSTGDLVSDLRGDPYGTLKHMDELAFRAASREVGSTCVIPRVFSVAGTRITKPALYALGSMVGMATTGGPIEVHARGPVFRSYCGVDEVVALSLWAALTGRDCVFDTCGTIVEMGDLARVVAQVHDLDAEVIRRSWDPDGVTDRYVGDGQVMEALAAEAGLSLQPLAALVRETSEWLKPANGQDG